MAGAGGRSGSRAGPVRVPCGSRADPRAGPVRVRCEPCISLLPLWGKGVMAASKGIGFRAVRVRVRCGSSAVLTLFFFFFNIILI